MPGKADTSGTHLWLVLMKAHQSLERYALRNIGQTGLGFSDFAVLEMLLHKGPLPVNALGAGIPLTSGSMTAAIDRLERRRLVRRGIDSADRRARIVHLTAEGRRLIGVGFHAHQVAMESAAEIVTQAERAVLIRLLKKWGKATQEKLDSSPQKGKTHVSKTDKHRSR